MKTNVEWMDLRTLKLLPLNARYMKHEVYQRLVKNIADDGQLTSVPFAARDENGDLLVLSGNHRVKGAIDGGVTHAYVMYTDDDLPEQRRIAIQLSHNALVGEDDPAILKSLYDQLEDIDWRSYSGLDDVQMGNLEDVSLDGLSEANLEFRTVNITFLPDELEDARQALEEATHQADEQWVARMREHSPLLDALDYAGRSYGIRNMATAFAVILNVFHNNLSDLEDGWVDFDERPRHGKWVPIASVLGTDALPPDIAIVLRRAIQRLVDSGDVEAQHKWKALEILAAEFEAGPR